MTKKTKRSLIYHPLLIPILTLEKALFTWKRLHPSFETEGHTDSGCEALMNFILHRRCHPAVFDVSVVFYVKLAQLSHKRLLDK